MPSWGIHLEIANRVNKKLNLNTNEFLFGNILPDIQDGYVVADISNIVNHLESHYYDGIHNTYERFYEFNKDIINEDISIGYLVHLLTDFHFNKYFRKKLIKRTDGNTSLKLLNGTDIIVDPDMAGITYKQHDFKIFERYIIKEYNPPVPNYQNELLYKCNLIRVININSSDVKNVIDYLENEMKNIDIKEEYFVFKNEELEELMEETEQIIFNYLEKVGVKK